MGVGKYKRKTGYDTSMEIALEDVANLWNTGSDENSWLVQYSYRH